MFCLVSLVSFAQHGTLPDRILRDGLGSSSKRFAGQMAVTVTTVVVDVLTQVEGGDGKGIGHARPQHGVEGLGGLGVTLLHPSHAGMLAVGTENALGFLAKVAKRGCRVGE